MSQVMKGLLLGNPGKVGAQSPICILYGNGAPASNPDPFVSGAAQGSLYVDYTTPALWFKSAASSWTQVSIP